VDVGVAARDEEAVMRGGCASGPARFVTIAQRLRLWVGADGRQEAGTAGLLADLERRDTPHSTVINGRAARRGGGKIRGDQHRLRRPSGPLDAVLRAMPGCQADSAPSRLVAHSENRPLVRRFQLRKAVVNHRAQPAQLPGRPWKWLSTLDPGVALCCRESALTARKASCSAVTALALAGGFKRRDRYR